MRRRASNVFAVFLLLILQVAGACGGGGGGDEPASCASPMAVTQGTWCITIQDTVNNCSLPVDSTPYTAEFSQNGNDLSATSQYGSSYSGALCGNQAVMTREGLTVDITFSDAGNASGTTTWESGTCSGIDTFVAVAGDCEGNAGQAHATPPTVTSTSPADGATDVLRNDVITATFSEDMNSSTITDATFTVGNATGAVSYDGATKTATFTPSGKLDASAVFNVTITTGVQDTAGNPMSDEVAWSFMTGTSLGEEEPNDDWSTAQSTTLPETIKGIADSPTDTDNYKFTISDEQSVTITLTGGGSVELQLWSGSAEMFSVTPVDGTATINALLNADTYYIRVFSWNTSYAVNYTLNVS